MRTYWIPSSALVRVRLDITGVVQGVGFRPAVARVAVHTGVTGIVFNDAGSVHCELQGTPAAVDAAVAGIRLHPPPMAHIDEVRISALTPHDDDDGFHIVDSRGGDSGRTLVPPDIALCPDCLREMRDPADRRFRHPFITCTNCGPRYTVIVDLPYDRPATTMAHFPMCGACAAEYGDPADRRFHAQTIACPDCGPTLSWHGPVATADPLTADPLTAAVRALEEGLIVAVKGVGGYHLACRADDGAAVAELRRRKARPTKPFGLMVADLGAAGAIAGISVTAAAALTSAAAPIVLVPRRDGPVVAEVAPGLDELGVMLAYSPVHHLLFAGLGAVPLVMTSANQGGSPIVFRDMDLSWIDGLADGVLGHDRPIHVPCEDSVVRVGADADGGGAVTPIRRSRGYAPLPVAVTRRSAGPAILATGGDLKTTFCLMGADGRAHMSPHLGDMADPRTQASFDSALNHLVRMTDRRPQVIACDMHPGYATTKWAQRQQRPIVAVQHHHAHAVSLLTEHAKLGIPIIAVTYDGTGYGTDGVVWGGELLAITDPVRFTRVGHLREFALPGGDGAVRSPARIALDLLYRAKIPWEQAPAPVNAMGADGIHVLHQQIPRGVGCVPTTSMGRLFDAVSSLLGICQDVTYEGQAAIELEQVARGGHPVPMDFTVHNGVLEPIPVMHSLVAGLRGGAPVADLAAGFHDAVIRATATAAVGCARTAGITTIGLTGGVFVNRLLRDGLQKLLADSGFDVLTHRTVPCNDGGLALGQAVIAAAVWSADGTQVDGKAAGGGEEGSGICVSVSRAR